MRCPYCNHEGEFKVLKQWQFRFYTVKMIKCPKCNGVFNYYSGRSPKTGKMSEFLIKLQKKV